MAITDDKEVSEQVEPRDRIVRKLDRGEPEEKSTRINAGSIFRMLILVAIVAFLGLYVGPGDMVKTLLKVAVAVALSAALFVGANLLFDQAYSRWTMFNIVIGVFIGFGGYMVLENNGLFRSLFDERVTFRGEPYDINAWLWGLVGGAALGLVMFVLSAPRQRLARLPLAVVGFTAFGVLTALAFDESARPALDWGKIVICAGAGAIIFGVLALLRGGTTLVVRSALTGVGLGWAIGAWGGGEVGRGNLSGVLLATVVPASVLGLRFGLTTQPAASHRRRIDQRSRSWIFLLPALTFIAAGLVIPLVKTSYQSFRNRDGSETVGLENYRQIFNDKGAFNLDNWDGFVGSRLFWIGLAAVAIGIVAGVVGGRRTRQPFERGESSSIPIFLGFFLVACAVLSTIRGTIFNNIWWVVVVTTLSTALGLGVAVLADRSRGENVAKSLIFLPMAISFVGAGIIWRFMYIGRPTGGNQTGVMNSLWVWLGQISNSTIGQILAVIVLGAIAVGLGLLIRRGVRTRTGATAGAAAGFLLIVLYLMYRLVGPGLGGFVTTESGETVPDPIIFFEDLPFNNMWLMAILIWIQTGFAMVILSAAIKAVPQDLTEAAKMDGASENQVFWRITMPQVAPTIGVVVTTLIVTVMKVFDIVKVSTNGNFGTDVIANQMFTSAFGNSNEGLGAALAVILFISVMPVMYINIRRMQRARA
ncbi:MAG: sugar ABC transporter permease [Acidimicrobiia bacterium]|nr:sugar ABC transporter permease [Acidimicrobiia bacterium]